MKKQVIVILSLVLLVAITLGAYLFVRNNNHEKQKKRIGRRCCIAAGGF